MTTQKSKTVNIEIPKNITKFNQYRETLKYMAISITVGYILIELQKLHDNIVSAAAITFISQAYSVIINLVTLLFIISLYNTAKSYISLLQLRSLAVCKSSILHEKTESNVFVIKGMVETLRRG